jgi:hypothetical protein
MLTLLKVGLALVGISLLLLAALNGAQGLATSTGAILVPTAILGMSVGLFMCILAGFIYSIRRKP